METMYQVIKGDSEQRPHMDITAPRHIQIVVDKDTIWINDEVACLLRACKIGSVTVIDNREVKDE